MSQQARRSTVGSPRLITSTQRSSIFPQPRVTTDQIAGLAILDFLEQVLRDGTVSYREHPGLNIARMSISRAFDLTEIPLDFAGPHTERPLRSIYQTLREPVKAEVNKQATEPKPQHSNRLSQYLSNIDDDLPELRTEASLRTAYQDQPADAAVKSPALEPKQRRSNRLSRYFSKTDDDSSGLGTEASVRSIVQSRLEPAKAALKQQTRELKLQTDDRISQYRAKVEENGSPDSPIEVSLGNIIQDLNRPAQAAVKQDASEFKPQKSAKISSQYLPDEDDSLAGTPSTSRSGSPNSVTRPIHRRSKSESLSLLYNSNKTISRLLQSATPPRRITSARSRNFLSIPSVPTSLHPVDRPTNEPYYLKYFCSSATQLQWPRLPNAPVGTSHTLSLYYNKSGRYFSLHVDGQTLPFPTLSFYDCLLDPSAPGIFAVRGPTPKCTKLAIRPDPRNTAGGACMAPKSYDLDFVNYAALCGFLSQYREVSEKENSLPLQQLDQDAEMDALFLLEAPVEKMGVKSAERFLELAQGKNVVVVLGEDSSSPSRQPHFRPSSPAPLQPPAPRPVSPPITTTWAVEGTLTARDTSSAVPGRPLTYRVRGELVLARDEDDDGDVAAGAEEQVDDGDYEYVEGPVDASRPASPRPASAAAAVADDDDGDDDDDVGVGAGEEERGGDRPRYSTPLGRKTPVVRVGGWVEE